MNKQEQEIEFAQQLLDFLKNGGSIQQLPPQRNRKTDHNFVLHMTMAKRKS